MLRIVIYLMYPLFSKVSTVRTHEVIQTISASFNRQQKFCSQCYHALDLSTNLPKLYVWNVLINEGASILLTSAKNICCSVSECSTLTHRTNASCSLNEKSDEEIDEIKTTVG